MLVWPIKSGYSCKLISNFGPTQKDNGAWSKKDGTVDKPKEIGLNKSSLILGHCISTKVILNSLFEAMFIIASLALTFIKRFQNGIF